MKFIQGKGLTATGRPWGAIVPDDATSAQDPRGRRVEIPADSVPTSFLAGVAYGIKHSGAPGLLEALGEMVHGAVGDPIRYCVIRDEARAAIRKQTGKRC